MNRSESNNTLTMSNIYIENDNKTHVLATSNLNESQLLIYEFQELQHKLQIKINSKILSP